ncbi:hypothetical protein DUNSADRAFT_1904 [Dunaliella salina]|uniref:Tudor domain-containing protein n=1 Tax=Dunaliella salina TaxID=3046 RepID=A0ABQ7GWG7_DUNSA|nr:hypothetical protein DUNSADRAFT_1904 [Dunaliella salina]|eukprot:KAF5838959.1 hypothetical protein DUNSADRAFT_1904 [Dunaliella salina]
MHVYACAGASSLKRSASASSHKSATAQKRMRMEEDGAAAHASQAPAAAAASPAFLTTAPPIPPAPPAPPPPASAAVPAAQRAPTPPLPPPAPPPAAQGTGFISPTPLVLQPTNPAQGVGFINPPPPGLKASKAQPQAPGKMLTSKDISPNLKGRHAELFWPADGNWYLIEIQDVDVGTKTARIVYTTGELEELELGDIIQNQHMSLISL